MPALILAEEGALPVQIVTDLVSLGTLGVIEGPWKADSLAQSVRRALHDLPSGMIYGDLNALSLPGLISTICNEGRQVSLRIQYAGECITIYFDRGEMIHARWNGLEGKEAVFEALRWGGGRFEIVAGEPAPGQTIHTNWSGLLLEGLQRIDEEVFDQEQIEPEIPPAATSKPFPEVDDVALPSAASASRGPTFDLDSASKAKVEERIAQLYRSLRPRSVLLTDHSGRLLYLQGDIERSRALSLAALVAGSFSATREIAEIVGREDEHREFQQSLQEGVDFSLYSAEAGREWILAVAFEPDETILGLARQFTLQAATDLAAISSQRAAAPEETHEVAEAMDDVFRQGVGDALEDLFG